MSNAGLAKVSRRQFNLETVVFSAQQEVTVPAGIKIPASTQYLLHPMLVMPKDKVTASQSPGKVRVQGQLEGFLSYVDSDEAVHTVQVPTMEFMTAFTVPMPGSGYRLETDAALEGVEVDRGEDNVANITAYIIVTLAILKFEETELVTAVSGNSLTGETRAIKLQNIVQEAGLEKTLVINLPELTEKPVAIDLCIGSLGWHVLEGKVSAQGVAMAKAFSLTGEDNTIEITQGSQDFELELDFQRQDISDCMLQCYPVKTAIIPGPQGQEVELTLKVIAVGYQEQSGEYMTNVIGADSLTKAIHLRNRVGESEFKLNLDGECQFPSEPVTVDVVLPKVRLIETKAQDEKVLVRGLLSLNIYYTDENEHKRVLVQEEEFSHSFELKGCAIGYFAKAWAWPETVIFAHEQYSVPILLRVEVVEDMEFTAVTDVHVIDPNLIPVDASVVLYVVAKDDSLFNVARKFNISQEMLLQYNGLSGTDKILPGQKLLIPVYQLKYKS